MKHLRVLLLVVAALGALLLSARDSSAAGTFSPTTALSLSNGGANTAADVSTILTLPVPDMNFGAIVGFIPPEWGVAEAGNPATGTQVGGLTVTATLGLFNGACNITTPVLFDLLNGSVNTAVTIDPLPAATANRLSPLVPPNGVNQYPSYLNTFFQGVVPHARLVGHAVVAGDDIILNLVIFKPGTQLPPGALFHRFVQGPLAFDPRLGFPVVIVLQDPTASEGPSFITDFCSPLVANTVTFDNIRTNPGDGTYTWVTFAASLRNAADGDILENDLDTCPFVPNVEDPRIGFPFGDPDTDAIDSACDLFPNIIPDPDLEDFLTASGPPLDALSGISFVPWSESSPCRAGSGDDVFAFDCDLDGFPNRQDNCPQLFNPLQEDADFDGIGDACDILGAGGGIGLGPNTPDGTPIELCLARSVTIPGSGTSVAVTPTDFQPCGNAPLPPLCNGQFATIFGTPFNDTINGTPGPDVIHGLGGNDTILGKNGDDVICGGDGNDTLRGGFGNDLLFGEGGDDRMFGGFGGDELFGGDGNDELRGDNGDDLLFGGNGNDRMFGGPGGDELFGEGGDDRLNGGPAVDFCDGGPHIFGDIAMLCEPAINVFP